MKIRAFDGSVHVVFGGRSGPRRASAIALAALAALCTAAAAHAQAPANDDCTNATILTQPNFPYHITQDGSAAADDTVNADLTALGGTTSDPVNFNHGVWFSFTPTDSGYITFTDAALDVLSGQNRFFTLTTACGATAISSHAYDPFAPDVNGAGGTEYHVTAGQTLKILVSNGADIFGPVAPTANYDLSFNFFPSQVPANSTCATAIDLSSALPFTDVVDNSMAGNFTVNTGDCAGSTIYHGVWYKYTATVRGYLTCTSGSTGQVPDLFSNDSSFLQPTIWATADDCGHNASCIGDATAPRYVILTAGQTIYLLVGSSDPSIGGNARLRPDITFTPAPSNDVCATALDLNAATLPYSGTFDFFAAKSNISQTSCFQAYRGVWFTYTPSWTGYLGFVLGATVNANQVTWAHTTDCAIQATCDGSSGGTVDRIPITAGQPIRILFASSSPTLSGPDPRELQFDLAPDDCETALPIAIPSTTSGDLAYATASSPQIPGICGNPADRDYWYKVSVATAGQYTFTLTTPVNLGAGSQLALALFSGCPSAGGTLRACTAAPVDAEAPQTIQMNLTPGTYLLRVAYGGGTFTLSASGPPACPADFDGNSTVNVSDIFAFLRAWFAHSSSADIDGNSVVNVSDIFAFLRHWFAHC